MEGRGSEVAVVQGDIQSLPERINKIEHALEVANTPDQCKQIMAITEAAIAYAKGLGAQTRRLEILRFRAEEKLGLVLMGTPKAPAGRPPKVIDSEVEPISRAPTLEELGISKKLSMRVQQIAKLPAEVKAKVLAGELRPNQALADQRGPAMPSGLSETDRLRAKVEEMTRDYAELEARFDELGADFKVLMAENESLQKLVDSGDQVKAALAEAEKYRKQVSLLERRLEGIQNERNAAVSQAKSMKSKLDKKEKVAA